MKEVIGEVILTFQFTLKQFSSLSDPYRLKINMVLTTAQMTTFFKNANQMGIQHATVVQLAWEGIQSIDDLANFDKDALQQLVDNLRRQGGESPIPIQVQLLVR